MIINDTIKWGVVGCGSVCEVKSAPAMNKIEGSQLVSVMRRNETKIKDYAQRHGVPKWTTDAEALINDPDINAIYIATPPDAHLKYTIMAANAGKPVYVEKPMARNYAECLAMIEVCKQANVPLFVAYYRRTLPHFVKVKELVDQGHLGDIRFVHLELYQTVNPALVDPNAPNWRIDPEIAGGGFYYDLASHQLDYLDYLLGPIKTVHGIAKNQAGLYEVEDIVLGNFEFESGVLGTGSWCFTVAEQAKKEVATIVGNKGKITFHFFGNTKVTIESDTLNESYEFQLPKHIQQPLIQTIVDQLHGKGTCPSDGISGARTNWVMEEMTADFYRK